MYRLFLFSCILIFGSSFLQAQEEKLDSTLVQFSGMVLDGSDDNLFPIPFANILIRDEARGTFSDFNGFFSVVAKKGSKITFSAVGYRDVDFMIPDSLEDNRYSVVQLMSQDTINLPETVVFPWPSRDHFKLEFLAMDVTSELQEKAIENIAEKSLRRLREIVPADGNENADYYLRQEAQSYYYLGQTPPMNIFSPVAWGKFFESWKNGDFKKKDDDK